MIWKDLGIIEARLDIVFLAKNLSAVTGARRAEPVAETSWNIEAPRPRSRGMKHQMCSTATVATIGSPMDTGSLFLVPCSSWAVSIGSLGKRHVGDATYRADYVVSLGAGRMCLCTVP